MTKEERKRIEDAYKTLDVPFGTGEDEVKSAYRKAAREKHPDVNQSPGATAEMQKVNEAKEIIDEFLEEGVDVDSKKEPVQESRQSYHESNENKGSEPKHQKQEQRSSRQSESSRSWDETPKWNYRESFSEASKGHSVRFEDSFYGSVIGEVNRISRDQHVIKKFLEEMRQRKGGVLDQTDFVKALIRKAKLLTDIYFINKEVNVMMDLEYRKEVKKSFVLVLAILNRVQTISGLDDELNLVRSEIASEAGIELWNELKQPGDLTYRMYVVRAILNGKKIEEIVEEFKENGREILKEYVNAEVESEHYTHYYKAA